jgi:hypothetical protein
VLGGNRPHGTRVDPAVDVSDAYPESPPQLRGSKLTGGDGSVNRRIGEPRHRGDVGHRNEMARKRIRMEMLEKVRGHMPLAHSWLGRRERSGDQKRAAKERAAASGE